MMMMHAFLEWIVAPCNFLCWLCRNSINCSSPNFCWIASFCLKLTSWINCLFVAACWNNSCCRGVKSDGDQDDSEISCTKLLKSPSNAIKFVARKAKEGRGPWWDGARLHDCMIGEGGLAYSDSMGACYCLQPLLHSLHWHLAWCSANRLVGRIRIPDLWVILLALCHFCYIIILSGFKS